MFTSKKKKNISKIGLVCRLFSSCANRNVFQTHISASPMVSFRARNCITFVDYLKAMINKFTILISIYLYGVLNRGKDKNHFSYFQSEKSHNLNNYDTLLQKLIKTQQKHLLNELANLFIMIIRKFIDVLKTLSLNLTTWEKLKWTFCLYFFNIFLNNLQTKPNFSLAIIFLGCTRIRFNSQCELTNIWSRKNIK